ncbi:MAG TPA: hypothetical protein VFV39_10355 [Limnobacter sp.]|nr:hypothetical protein [Limnobacter sp.]
MFTSRVMFNDFFFSSMLASLMLWITLAFPLHVGMHVAWTHLGLIFPVVYGTYLVWNYFYFFKSTLPVGVFITQAILGVACYIPFCFFVDMVIYLYRPVLPRDQISAINSLFSSLVLFFGITIGYLNAKRKTPGFKNKAPESVTWISADVDLTKHAYFSPQGISRFTPLLLTFGGIGFIFILPVIELVLQGVEGAGQELTLRIACMTITLILYTYFAVSIGEAIRLIQIERSLGKGPLQVYDFDLRLKWRHDYVKYHLPTPIRKLNLRLFNQHVEAYERYLKGLES